MDVHVPSIRKVWKHKNLKPLVEGQTMQWPIETWQKDTWPWKCLVYSVVQTNTCIIFFYVLTIIW